MNKKFWIYFGTATLAGLFAYFVIPKLVPRIAAIGPVIELPLAAACAVSILQLGAVWYFMTSTKTFKKSLRNAYYILAAGIFVFSLAQIQLPIIVFWNPPTIPDWLAWTLVSPNALGPFIIYLATWKFARLLKVRNVWTSPIFALVVVAILAFGSSFLPHTDLGIEEYKFDLVSAIYVVGGSFALMAMVTVFNIRQLLGPSYRVALGWLAIALGVLALGTFHEITIKTLPVFSSSNYAVYNFSIWPLIVACLLLLKAGMSFKDMALRFASIPENASYVDVVVAVGRLVSKPDAIEAHLDKVRVITARHSSGALTQEDKKVLLGVYLEIEKYLTTKDVLRDLTQQDLRTHLPSSFQAELAKQTGTIPGENA